MEVGISEWLGEGGEGSGGGIEISSHAADGPGRQPSLADI